MPRPAKYHLLLLPDGAWDTVECLAAMIRRHATVPTVIIDMSSAERLNIDTLAILVRKAVRLRSAGGELLLVAPTAAVRRLIERTGSGCVLRTLPGRAAAVRYLARDGRTWRPADLAEKEGTCLTELLDRVRSA
ncbi:STAS domain-containing protein [Streptomyces sp. NPDC059785]|uniref:STAS domain-containing protein n=1 Tax=unclassified Streptomyces TaxID=2593676 RepID=UPI0036549AAE